MSAVEATIGILDKDGAARLMRALDESGSGAGPWRHIADRAYGDARGIFWNGVATINASSTPAPLVGAPGATLRSYLTGLQLCADTLAAATEIVIQDGSGGAVLWRGRIQASGLALAAIPFETPLKGSLNASLHVATLTAVAGNVYVSAQGYAA